MTGVTPTSIEGAWIVTPDRFGDERGWFQEWFRASRLREETGVDFRPVQTNVSKSARGTVRGVHYSMATGGQGKFVTVISGAIDDYVVDIRLGSPTFGEWTKIRLTADEPMAVLIDPHLGHAFHAVNDNTIVCYLVDAEYNPTAELGISPRELLFSGDDLDSSYFLLSDRDRDAPSLNDRVKTGELPKYPRS